MSSERKRMFRTWPEGYASLSGLTEKVQASGLELSLVELIKIRASQINGCAYCLDKHTKDARAAGETEQRLYGLSAWRESPFYTEQERAALAITEAVTLVSEGQVPQAILDEAAEHFSREEMTHVLFTVIEINAWNRLAITTGAPEAGSYEPA